MEKPYSFEQLSPGKSVERSKKKMKCIVIITASLLSSCILVLVLALVLSPSISRKTKAQSSSSSPSPSPSPSPPPTQDPQVVINSTCKATRYPDLCQSSLTQSKLVPSNPAPFDVIQSAMSISSENLKTANSMITHLLASSAGNQNLTKLAKTCLEILGYSERRTALSNASFIRGAMKNARAFMSASLAYQNGCSGGLKYQGGNTLLVNQSAAFLDKLVNYTSNALSMMVSYDLYGNDTSSWKPPQTERDGFWEEPESDKEVELGASFPSSSMANVTVCKNKSSGCTKTVQEAVNLAPDNLGADQKFVIHIKEGVYEETVRVPLEKKNVVFLGDGIGKTVITGSLKVGQAGMSTFESATVGVLGDGFMASGLTIQNTAGAPTHQAVAFRSDSDQSVIKNCEFLGNQDTLYANSLRQYYESCRIQGNVDFIFGNSAAIFQDCEILISPRLENPEQGGNNAVTAHGRTDPAQSTGFVFRNCRINGTKEYMALFKSKPSVHINFLGRPWKEYSRVVFINCDMEAVITPQGWMPWSGDFALKTLYYGEFENKGPGSNLSQRVEWSSQIPKEHVSAYSLQNFIQGNRWISTSSSS